MQVLEKRTYDRRLFDIDCSGLLEDDEEITSVFSVTADQGALTFGNPQVNADLIEYPAEFRSVAAGKVIQVEIRDGTLPSGMRELLCTVRARFETNQNPRLEAAVPLRLTDRVEADCC